MDVIDLTMNKDYYVPLTKKEMIEKLEYYKAFVSSFDRKENIQNKEYYELIKSLINLEISAFDISFPSYTVLPNILRDVLKYNVWELTKKTVDKFNNREILLAKEEDKPGYVKVYKSVISDIRLKPPYAFTQPFITINSYETSYIDAKDVMLDLRSRYEKLKNEQREYRIEELYSKSILDDDGSDLENVDGEEEYLGCDETKQNLKIEKNLEEYFKLNEEVENVRRKLNIYRKSLCLYKDSIYKEVAHALLEEYHIPNAKGKDYVKRLPWITLTKKSL